MKRIPLYFLFFSLVLAACQRAESSTRAPTSTPTEVSPVYVSALCTLMGMETRSDVPRDRPVIVMWGWTAATMEQVQEYVDAAVALVDFDGKDLSGQMQKDIPYDETAKIYRAVWMAGVGIPTPGLHVITYSLEFQKKIFDGVDYYGPATKNEKMSDRCEIDVR